MHPLWCIGAGATAGGGRHKGWVELENPRQIDMEKLRDALPSWGS